MRNKAALKNSHKNTLTALGGSPLWIITWISVLDILKNKILFKRYKTTEIFVGNLLQTDGKVKIYTVLYGWLPASEDKVTQYW